MLKMKYNSQEITCRSERGLKTSPTVFCKSCEPKPNRLKREVLPEAEAFSPLAELNSFDGLAWHHIAQIR